MSEIRYTRDHEWILKKGDIITLGVTAYAAEQMGDVVFVQLPELTQKLSLGEEAVVLESVKAAGDILAPFDCTVIAVNEGLVNSPEFVSDDPTGEGWFFKVQACSAEQFSHFMGQREYDEYIENL
ncbi:MAG: glycine cleavage system protein GcvH [Spongiibacteraceae bacterium]|nr:glycine cleavage system protein GcvH [Spongiibacteraceae bacterium]